MASPLSSETGGRLKFVSRSSADVHLGPDDFLNYTGQFTPSQTPLRRTERRILFENQRTHALVQSNGHWVHGCRIFAVHLQPRHTSTSNFPSHSTCHISGPVKGIDDNAHIVLGFNTNCARVVDAYGHNSLTPTPHITGSGTIVSTEVYVRGAGLRRSVKLLTINHRVSHSRQLLVNYFIDEEEVIVDHAVNWDKSRRADLSGTLQGVSILTGKLTVRVTGGTIYEI